MEFAQQFGGSYIAAEGALWRTLWRLLFWPGQLTLEYLAGRRRRYVLPLRLYLTVSVITLVLVSLISSHQLNSIDSKQWMQTDGNLEKEDVSLVALGKYRAGLSKGQFYCEELPDSVCKKLSKRLRLNADSIADEIRQAPERFFNHLGTAMFLLVPAFALLLKLAYWDKRFWYTEHLVFALHLHAFWFAMVLLMLSAQAALVTIAVIACLIYPLVALHRVYKTRWWSTALRSTTVALLYFICQASIFVVVSFWTLVS